MKLFKKQLLITEKIKYLAGDNYMDIVKKLFEMQDLSYRDFHAKLIPDIPSDRIIGVRTPALRAFAKEFFKSGEYGSFLDSLPHHYYEENNLHAFIIEQIKDYDTALKKCEEFLPYIDNWATCDAFLPHAFKKNKEKLIPVIMRWIKSDKTYTVRYATGLLMSLYLDDDFDEKYLRIVSEIRSDEYYINMMIAWYFATALAKQYDAAIPYITDKRLAVWTHNKTIQKCVESRRIDADKKEYLKKLKIKNNCERR